MLDAVCWRDDRDPPRHQARRRDGGGVHRRASPPIPAARNTSCRRHDRARRDRRPAEAARGPAPAARRRGLFAAERKKKLPFLPEVIGIVTSPTGAVIRDILHRLADRFPRRVLLWPVAVQGEGAAAQVAAAIAGFNRLRRRRRGAAARSAHRRARRRQPRRSDGVQRGDRRARRRRLGDPADLGGRARDRHDPDRPRQRPPRADPDRRGRDGGAGAARPDRRARRQGARGSPAACRGCFAERAAASCRARRAACPTRTT